jgi:hypothetical protein
MATAYPVDRSRLVKLTVPAVDVWRLRVASYFVVVVVFLKDDDDMLIGGDTGHGRISLVPPILIFLSYLIGLDPPCGHETKAAREAFPTKH